MFQLLNPTEVRLTSLTCRTEAAGPRKDVPAITLRLKMESVDNEVLDLLSKTARQTLYAAVEGQETLPGVAPTTPILRSKDIKHWTPEGLVLNGWKVMIEHGIDDASAIAMGKCKIDGFTADLYDGGHIDLEFRVSTSDIDSEGVGILWSSQKQVFPVTILAPELPKRGATEATGAEIDGTKGHPGAADSGQGSLLDDQAQTPEGALASSLGADTDPDNPDSEGGTTDPGAAEQAELEAGMAQSLASAGVTPKGGRRGRKPGAEVH
mgnify:CR=1 FL=1